LEVTAVAALEGKNQELRSVVGMCFEDELFERGEESGGGLEKEENFSTGLELLLPPVMRFEGGDEVDAGGESGVEGGLGEGAGDLEVGSSN
jgi:hypothetical protein